MLLAVEGQSAVQHIRIGTQMVPPELLADHGHCRCSRSVFSGVKSASFEWCDAKDRKEVRAHVNAGNPFRLSEFAQCEAAASTAEHRNLFERLLAITPCQEVSVPHGAHLRVAQLVCPRRNKTLRLGIRQWPEQDGVH